MQGQLTQQRWTIANGASTSNAQDLRASKLKAIQMPAAWTTADIAIYSRPHLANGDPGNATYQLALVIQAAAGQYRVLTSAEQRMCEGLSDTKLVSADHDSLPDPVNQGGDRLLIGIVEPR